MIHEETLISCQNSGDWVRLGGELHILGQKPLMFSPLILGIFLQVHSGMKLRGTSCRKAFTLWMSILIIILTIFNLNFNV